MLARRFLWVVAILTMLVVAGALAYRLFERQLMKLALVPTERFRSAPGGVQSDGLLWMSGRAIQFSAPA
jgi:peptidoglycan/LPS O-acetylase OafA/YrhL